MSQEQDKVFFRNYSLVIGALAVMIAIFMILARIFGIDEEAQMKQREEIVAERTTPPGQVSLVGEEPVAMEQEEEPAAAAPGGEVSVGESVYKGLCAACHAVPGLGAPVLGNAEEWAPRIAKGKETLYDHAINGFTGEKGFMMPARGGGTNTDEEVKAAVDYMVAQSGGPAAEESAAPAAEAGGEAAAEETAAAGKSGEEVYNAMCGACHGVPGIGAPVMGNAEEWAPRIAKGKDTLYDHAINGFTGEQGFMMPPRGGGTFTDEEVKAAVDYMVENSQ